MIYLCRFISIIVALEIELYDGKGFLNFMQLNTLYVENYFNPPLPSGSPNKLCLQVLCPVVKFITESLALKYTNSIFLLCTIYYEFIFT